MGGVAPQRRHPYYYDQGYEAGVLAGHAAAPTAALWGSAVASLDLGELAAQDLLADQTIDLWTAGAPTAADVFATVPGQGIRVKSKNGRNWTGSSDWTAPYVYFTLASVIGAYARTDWLSIILGFSWDSTALYGGSEVADLQLNYAKAGAIQNYRSEVRSNIGSTHGGGAVRTWAGTQSAANPASAFGSVAAAIELQILGGRVRAFRGTAFPSAPGVGMTQIAPTGGAARGEYPLEKKDPGDAFQYDPASDVIALSAYNYNGGAKTVTFNRIDVYRIDMGAFGAA